MSPLRRLPLAAAPEQRPEYPPDDVLPEPRCDDLAAGADRRIERLLAGPCVGFCLFGRGRWLPRRFPRRPLVRRVDLALLTRELALLLRRRHLVETTGRRGVEALAGGRGGRRTARRREHGQ